MFATTEWRYKLCKAGLFWVLVSAHTADLLVLLLGVCDELEYHGWDHLLEQSCLPYHGQCAKRWEEAGTSVSLAKPLPTDLSSTGSAS